MRSNSIKEQAINWLKSGAVLADGIRLFAIIAGGAHPFLKILKANAEAHRITLIKEITRRMALDQLDRKDTFRENWPFLSAPDCPPELKVLAADKITAYHNYVSAHPKLFEASTNKEQYEIVSFLVENYKENQLIIKEFKYYKEHGKCLGLHPIFKEFKALAKLRKLSPIALMSKLQKLEQNIWRIKSEISKKDKPHLLEERKTRLKQKQRELAEVKRLIKSYE